MQHQTSNCATPKRQTAIAQNAKLLSLKTSNCYRSKSQTVIAQKKSNCYHSISQTIQQHINCLTLHSLLSFHSDTRICMTPLYNNNITQPVKLRKMALEAGMTHVSCKNVNRTIIVKSFLRTALPRKLHKCSSFND